MWGFEARLGFLTSDAFIFARVLTRNSNPKLHGLGKQRGQTMRV
jgi:hypothetical protein